MAGAPRFGKISTGIRRNAKNAQRAIATTATSAETGRLSAASTNRMSPSLFPHQPQERCQIAFRSGHAQQSSPDAQTRKRIVDLCLREETLRLSHFADVAKTGSVPGSGLLLRRARRFELDRRILRDP